MARLVVHCLAGWWLAAACDAGTRTHAVTIEYARGVASAVADATGERVDTSVELEHEDTSVEHDLEHEDTSVEHDLEHEDTSHDLEHDLEHEDTSHDLEDDLEHGDTSHDDGQVVVDERPITFVVVSDLNGSYGSTAYGSAVHRAVARVIELAPDLVLSTGDMVAGQQAGLDYDAMWSAFHAAVSDPLAAAGLPFAVTPGNHDGSGYPAFVAERATYVDTWSTRRPDVTMVDDQHYPLRYAFVHGPALFVSLDATRVGPLDAAQRAWLDDVLTAHGRDTTIVFGHMPLWPVAVGREDDYLGDAALEAILVRHGVDLVLAGHHHAYYPGRRAGLHQVSLACLGSGARRLIGTEATSPRSLLVVTVDASRVTSVEALGGVDFDSFVDRRTLPPEIGTGSLRIVRDDLAADGSD